MTTPREEQPPTPAAGPSVTTAPPRSRWNLHLGRVPSHVGPARTSTLVLAVLFVGVFALWLYVRPPSAQVGTAGGEGGTGAGAAQVQQTTSSTRTSTATTTRSPTPSSTPTRSSSSSAPATGSTNPPLGTTRSPTRSASSTPTTTGASTVPVPPLPPSSTGAPTS